MSYESVVCLTPSITCGRPYKSAGNCVDRPSGACNVSRRGLTGPGCGSSSGSPARGDVLHGESLPAPNHRVDELDQAGDIVDGDGGRPDSVDSEGKYAVVEQVPEIRVLSHEGIVQRRCAVAELDIPEVA